VYDVGNDCLFPLLAGCSIPRFMKRRPIKTKKEYDELLDRVDEQFDTKPAPESVLGQQVSAVLAQLKQYEDTHFPIPLPPFDGK
jgi:antitoxin component HigA of HigAB toxin-antitoxin module